MRDLRSAVKPPPPEPGGSPDAPAVERIAGLDLIRAAAILAVMVHHFRHLPGVPVWFEWIGLRGYVGVDLFFVLSGWLIGGQLLREARQSGRLDMPAFWARRWFRTLPSYYAMLFLLVATGRIAIGDTPTMTVFAQNYLDPLRWLLSWSLCIEEQFYLLLPVILGALLSARRSLRWAAVAVIVAFSPVLRLFEFPSMSRGSYANFLAYFYSPTHLRLDGLVLGVCVAAAREHLPEWWLRALSRKGSLAAAGCALAITASFTPWFTGEGIAGTERMRFFPAVPGFLLVSVGVASCIPWASQARLTRRWLAVPVTFVADHAYALYLTHEQVAGSVRALARARPFTSFWLLLATVTVVSFLAAATLRTVVERPFLRLRDRWLVRRSGPVPLS